MTTNDADHVSESNAHLTTHAAYIARRITGLDPEVEADREPETDDFHSSLGLWQPRPPATWKEA